METALAVTPLVLSTYTIIYKIKLAAEVASQNKDQCDFLAGRLSGIDKLLPLVQQQVPEAAEELTRLGHTLRDAHDLVVDCQNWSMRRKFTRAKRFTEVNARIDSHLNIIQLYCQVVDMSRRPDRTTVPLPTTASHSLTGSYDQIENIP
ncbi:hypothetical protein ACQ4PT_032561 [Festuca glaucescens]